MTKKAKEKLQKELEAHVSNRYHRQFEKVEVVDKKTCKLTLSVKRISNEPISILLPMESLGLKV